MVNSKMTIVGDMFDPVYVVGILRKITYVEILAVGPAKVEYPY